METIVPLSKTLDYSDVKLASMTMRAVNHKLRREMLELIKERGRISVTDIYLNLRLEQSVASQNLAILRKAKIVSTKRAGKVIYYALNDIYLPKVVAFTSNMAMIE